MRKLIHSLIACILLLMATVTHTAARDRIIDITSYGAVGDGKTLNTSAIQQAIDACTSQGGGKVRVPSGAWLTGTLLLKSNVTLLVEENATLLGSPDIKDYQVIDGFRDGLGQQMGYALIGAVDVNNTGITGKGVIDGQGKLVRASGGHERRPFLIRFVHCSNVTVTDIRLQGPTAWTMHFFRCSDITTKRVTIRSRGLGNNDGIDIDCCERVQISDCDIDSGDDAICFKTTSPYPCKDISVSNIKINTGEGAIKFGTESAGNFENISISKIDVAFAREGGIKLFSVDGAHLKNISISDIVMGKVNMPIIIRLGARLKTFRDGDAQQETGSISNISIRSVKVKNGTWTGMLISGIPGHYIDGLTLEDININVPGEGTTADAAATLEEKEKDYPEIKMFGKQIPAYALYIRHAKNIRFNNITFTSDKTDARPAVIAYDIEKVQLRKWQLPANSGQTPLIHITDSKSVQLQRIKTPASAQQLLHKEGNTENVTLD
ncbi:MAG TPA: glycoside hydrolase family 28 protein [Chitinophaga sp.]|uniref:glycoside hydrolase family 28 protein n=1 Tax=Chitinophaga sp. TaxID=1869181 RepID=UPI002B6F2CC7|nr:glycoside hydrolase family 28 protein [Chitinophaga sp.]HVI44471.1 glycoside hydrolase family 28 protein [Chitinophaga sp.]